MAQKNRQLAAKARRATSERIAYAQGMQALEASRPAHRAAAVSIIATHWGIEPDPMSPEALALAIADFKSRGRIKRLPTGEYKPRINGLNRHATSR